MTLEMYNFLKKFHQAAGLKGPIVYHQEKNNYYTLVVSNRDDKANFERYEIQLATHKGKVHSRAMHTIHNVITGLTQELETAEKIFSNEDVKKKVYPEFKVYEKKESTIPENVRQKYLRKKI